MHQSHPLKAPYLSPLYSPPASKENHPFSSFAITVTITIAIAVVIAVDITVSITIDKVD